MLRKHSLGPCNPVPINTSAVFSASIFWNVAARCILTVLTKMPSISAIYEFFLTPTTSQNTARWAGVQDQIYHLIP